jgi:hypothetical protein
MIFGTGTEIYFPLSINQICMEFLGTIKPEGNSSTLSIYQAGWEIVYKINQSNLYWNREHSQSIKPEDKSFTQSINQTCRKIFGTIAAHDSGAALSMFSPPVDLQEMIWAKWSLTAVAFHLSGLGFHVDHVVGWLEPVAAMESLLGEV